MSLNISAQDSWARNSVAHQLAHAPQKVSVAHGLSGAPQKVFVAHVLGSAPQISLPSRLHVGPPRQLLLHCAPRDVLLHITPRAAISPCTYAAPPLSLHLRRRRLSSCTPRASPATSTPRASGPGHAPCPAGAARPVPAVPVHAPPPCCRYAASLPTLSPPTLSIDPHALHLRLAWKVFVKTAP